LPYRTPVTVVIGLGVAIALAPVAVHAVVPRPAAGAAAPVGLAGRVTQVRDADGDGRVSAGDAVHYEFEVSATGSGLTDILVVSPLLGAVLCPSTPLAPGTTTTCAGHAPYVVTEADVAAGRFAVEAHAQGTDAGGGVQSSDPVTVSTATGTPTSAGRP
jgi:hypothetical protein